MAEAALKVPVPKALKKVRVRVLKGMDEYKRVAAEVGLSVKEDASVKISHFEAYLEKAGIAVYPLNKVVAYMDKKSKDDEAKYGWMWKPVRAKDGKGVTTFGQRATPVRYKSYINGTWSDGSPKYSDKRIPGRPASDHFVRSRMEWGRTRRVATYGHTIPLHALQKIAKIEKEFTEGDVKFMVSDYAPKPALGRLPDPFLMVLIPNKKLKDGVGRYVIDFWDEPGFGLKDQLGL